MAAARPVGSGTRGQRARFRARGCQPSRAREPVKAKPYGCYAALTEPLPLLPACSPGRKTAGGRGTPAGVLATSEGLGGGGVITLQAGDVIARGGASLLR